MIPLMADVGAIQHWGFRVDQEAARGKIKRLKKSKLKGMMETGMRLLGWSKGGTRLTSRNLKWP